MLESEELEPFAQSGFRCRLEWGWRGTRVAAARGDLLVVVDTLRFSTAVATAIHHGATVFPCAWEEDSLALAATVEAEVAVSSRDVPAKGRFSLSPLTYVGIEPGVRVVLPSPNGSACCRLGRESAGLFVGALVNARAVASSVAQRLESSADIAVTVLACGERWQDTSEDGDLRFAIEDYLGAGAILSNLPFPKSPEASVCEAAYLSVRESIRDILWQCASGRELRAKGFGDDVLHAARLDLYDSVPILRGDHLERLL